MTNLPDDPIGAALAGQVPPAHEIDADPTAYPTDLDYDGVSGDTLAGEDMDKVRDCASLDHSDTDNSERFIRHFGHRVRVIAQSGVVGGDFVGWTGTHWDIDSGLAIAQNTAKKIGDLIGLEAGFLKNTPKETLAIKLAEEVLAKKSEDRTDDDRRLLHAAEVAEVALEKRRTRRAAFGVSSKNKARIAAMLDLASSELRLPPERWNANRMRVACKSHTLTFQRVKDEHAAAWGDSEYTGTVKAEASHKPEDYITALLPVAYDPGATCPHWDGFLAQMLPSEEKRRSVRMFSGLSLLGTVNQFIMFHYGTGANGKSVFLETLVRLFGPSFAVGLPPESVLGSGDRGAGSASPDLARLFGKRMVRILEVKEGAPLQSDLIKRLTGGEAFPVRTLFKGFFEFQSVAKPHMSGNGKPSIDGGDYGLMRRLLVVHWDQTVPEGQRRNLDDMVSEFMDEASGILNWLIAGVLDYLATDSLYIAPEIRLDTEAYGADHDPVGQFIDACVVREDGAVLQANEAYQAFVSWSLANALRVRSVTSFGRDFAKKFDRDNGRVRYYKNIRLENVPARPETPYPSRNEG